MIILMWCMVAFGLGVMAGAIGSLALGDRPLNPLREHARYMRRARWAYVTRRPGLARIEEEAAARVLGHSERKGLSP